MKNGVTFIANTKEFIRKEIAEENINISLFCWKPFMEPNLEASLWCVNTLWKPWQVLCAGDSEQAAEDALHSETYAWRYKPVDSNQEEVLQQW